MKLVKEHILFGVLDSQQTINVLQNTLPNHGWRIIDFEIFPQSHADINLDPNSAKSAKLTTFNVAGPDFHTTFDYDKNTVVGVASFCGGVQSNMIDSSTLIVNDLFVTQMLTSPGVTNSKTCYQIILEQYDISDDEQVLAIIRENSQSID